MRKRIQEYWEKEAYLYCRTYPEEFTYKDILENWIKVILEECNGLGKKLTILELGTGTGHLVKTLMETGNIVVGIDISKAMVEISRKRTKKIEIERNIFQMDAQSLLFDDESFDLLIADNLVWTLDNPLEAYREWYRVLKKGGRLLIFDANWNLWRFNESLKREYDSYQKYLFRKYHRGTHIYFNRKEAEEIEIKLFLSNKSRPEWDIAALEKTGFKNLYIEKDISRIVWDSITYEYNRITLPFMISAGK